MRLKLVVFDVDGTLVDSQAHILAAAAAAFEAEGLAPPSHEAVLSIVGLSLPVALARLAPDLPATRISRLLDAYLAAFGASRIGPGAASPMYPGAREALARLKSRDDVLLGIATGKSRRGLFRVLEGHGLTGWFQTLQCADDHPSKPHPAMLHATLAETGADAGDTIFVGDTSFDMEMGRAAGVLPLGVSWGYHPVADLTDAGAARVIDGFDALTQVLDTLWEGTHG